VSILLYCIAEEDDMLTTTGISDEERKSYNAVMSKCDEFFKVQKTWFLKEQGLSKARANR